jgi:putative ABC transport system permease protein
MAAHTLFRDARQDAAVAGRMLARRPGFTAVALVTLALGIGAPTAIFSVVNAVLLRPLPYPEPDRVVSFRIESETPQGPFKFDALPVSEALDWIAQSNTLASLAVFNDRALTLTTTDGPYRLAGISTTTSLFDLLGVTPAVGRVFESAETDLRQIVLSHEMWRRFFNSDPAIVTRTITLDGEVYRVTGVMPRGFGFPTPDAMFWVPQILQAGGSRGMLLPAVARLKPGVTTADVVTEGTAALGGDRDARVHQVLIARTLKEQMTGGIQRVLWVLMAAVTLVSIIATVNIALMLLTRGASREREFSIRLALGAGRGRIARQLFVEAVILSAIGGVAGVALAVGGLKVLMQLAPPDLPRLHEASIDAIVLFFALAVTGVTSIAFGLLSGGRIVAFDALRRLSGSVMESRLAGVRPGRRQLNVLAASELALTMVLLVGAGLLLRSFVALVMVPPGFEPGSALAFSINLPASRYPTAGARMAFLDGLEARLLRMPGVEAAGLAAEMPHRQPTGRFEFSATGIELFPDPMSRPVTETRMVGDGFFEAIGIPVRAGRTFTAADTSGAEDVIVISEMFARRQFGDRNPIGQTLYSGSGNRRVIGVVADVRPADRDAEQRTAAYLPLRQEADLLAWHAGMNVVVRSRHSSDLPAAVRALVLSLDQNLPASNVRFLSDELSNLVAAPRFSATVLGVFAAIALVMASLGVYGVMAYAASLRTREIGVRVALGATRSQVVRLIMRDAVIVIAAGLGAGVALAMWLARGLTGLLHEMTPADPVSTGAVAALLAVAAFTAAYTPARRAARLNVLTALRDE